MKSNPMINSFRFLAILTFVILHAVPGHGQQLIPQPSELAYAEGRFTITPETVIVPHESDDLAGYLNDHIERVCGFRLRTVPHTPETNYISLRRGGHLGNEAYTLSIEPEHIIIRGGDRGGVFYGLQTLFQLMPPEVYGQSVASAPQPLTLDAVSVKDGPRYAYRGAMLDVSRTFFDKQAVMQYLDWMSRHKLNKFHWHLTDDNGWRIEIKKYPELTAKGAWRGPGEVLPPSYGSGQRRYGGYYSQDDIREIVRYAAFRNIEVIPEINLPGHALALTASYPETFCRTTDDPDPNGNGVTGNVLCAAREENFEMIRDIIHEVAELFPSHYLHLGSDEVSTRYWKKCPHCKARMEALAERLDIKNALPNLISECSHGMKQKIAVIGALIHEPKLILMDEPFVGLDPIAAHELKEIMAEHCRNGGAIFFSTHVLEVAEKLCDNVAIIKNGKLIAHGTMDSVRGDGSLEQVFLELEDHKD